MADGTRSLVGSALKGVSAGLKTYAAGKSAQDQERIKQQMEEERRKKVRVEMSKVLRDNGLTDYADLYESLPEMEKPDFGLFDKILERRTAIEDKENEGAYASMFGEPAQMFGPGLQGFDFTPFAIEEGVGPAYGETPGGLREAGESLSPYAEMFRDQTPALQKIPGFKEAAVSTIQDWRAKQKASIQRAEERALGIKPKVELTPEQEGEEAGRKEAKRRGELLKAGFEPEGYVTPEEKAKKQKTAKKEQDQAYREWRTDEKQQVLSEANDLYRNNTTPDQRVKVGILGVNTIEDLQSVAKNIDKFPELKKALMQQQSALGMDFLKGDKEVGGRLLDDLFNRYNNPSMTKGQWVKQQEAQSWAEQEIEGWDGLDEETKKAVIAKRVAEMQGTK